MRKGQFYMIDAFFAAAILFLGVGFLMADYVNAPEQRYAQQTTDDLVALLYSTEIGDIDNEYIRNNHLILDETLSPMEQAHVWAYDAQSGCASCLAEARALIGNVSGDVVPDSLGYSVRIIASFDHVLLNRSIAVDPVLMLVGREVLMTAANSTVYGPDTMEVRVWQ